MNANAPVDEDEPSLDHAVLGLIAAAIAGWAVSAVLMLGWPFLLLTLDPGHHPAFALDALVLYFLFAVILGLPAALIGCFVLGYPLWRWAYAVGWRGGGHAAMLGGIVGLAIGLVAMALSLGFGLRTALVDNLDFGGFLIGRQGAHETWAPATYWTLQLAGVAQGLLSGVAGGIAAHEVNRFGRRQGRAT